MTKMTPAAAAAILAFVGQASAYWRMPCMGVAGVARIDPIVDSGKEAAHMHTLKGGNAISTSCTADELLKSDCTSCQIEQDKSAYWTPQMYFFHEDGSVEAVPEVNGHITYYKFTPSFTSKGLTTPKALPNGLRIVAGDTLRRNFTLPVPDPPKPWSGEDSTQDAIEQKSIGFNCMNYGGKPEDTLYRHFLPDKNFLDTNCPNGLRLEIGFPFCWNGQDLDSDDHKSHMAYPDQGQYGGKCPDGYDTVVNQLLFETIYPTHEYADKAGYFAFSNGDPTGYGYHGDAFIAWDEGVLQEATEQCGPDAYGPGKNGVVEECPVFKLVSEEDQAKCQIPIEGDLKYNMKAAASALPGNNPIQKGPERATKASGGDSSAQTPAPKVEPPKPSLAFSRGSADGFTDKIGNVYLQKTDKPEAPKEAAPTPAPAPVSVSVAAPAPAVSAPAAYEAAPAPDANVDPAAFTTVYETQGHEVIAKVIYKTAVTVTEGAQPTAVPKRRRHAHHLHQHQQHAHARR